MAAPGAKLVPITRAFLAKFYDQYPLDPLPAELDSLKQRVEAATEALDSARKGLPDQKEDLLANLLVGDIPHKLDQNLWKNREMLEEIVFLTSSDNWPASLKADPLPPAQAAVVEAIKGWNAESSKLLEFVSDYQKRTSERISDMVLTYMPQDFRGTLFRQMKDRSELRRQQEVATLVAGGGTIKQKYALLWQQQMDRRTTLAALGSATGMYRTLVTYLAGVPQVLLDFVKTINDHNGPMEEQRVRYGPHLYDLTNLVNRVQALLAIWWQAYDSPAAVPSDLVGLITESLNLYSEQVTKYINRIQETFENAPFLISADEAASGDEFKEETISYGAAFSVPLTVDVEGTVVAWEFNLTSGKDIGFSVDYVPKGGTKTGVFPYIKVETHQGSFNAPGVGSYTLLWDNTYSYLTRKVLRYKVGAIPPIETAEQVAAEEALTHPEGVAPADAQG